MSVSDQVSHDKSYPFLEHDALQRDACSLSVTASNEREAQGYARIMLTRMLAVADPVAAHTGLTGPLLAVYYHFDGFR